MINNFLTFRSQIRCVFHDIPEERTVKRLNLLDVRGSEAANEEFGECAEKPSYQILARLAEIWLTGYEEENIRKDPKMPLRWFSHIGYLWRISNAW